MASQQTPPTVEEASQSKSYYGTHDYPPHHENIQKEEWGIIIVGAGPAGLMLGVSTSMMRRRKD